MRGGAGGAGSASTPGSQQDFVVNVGDRVFFETDQTELTALGRATLDKQAQWLTNYSQYAFTIEGHADERGTREYNIALGARRAQSTRDYLISRGIQAGRMQDDLLRQGTPGRGLQRHFVLVAEPPRGDGAQRRFVRRRALANIRRNARPQAAGHFAFGRLFSHNSDTADLMLPVSDPRQPDLT